MLAAVCDKMQIPSRGINVVTIKKHMTGKCNANKQEMNANKQEMILAAYERNFDPVDDNEADALGVLLFGQK